MKRILLTSLFFVLCVSSLRGQEPLSARESEPSNFGWMKGFPPHPSKVLSAITGNFFEFPALRYSVCHMREFFPSVNVPAPQEGRYEVEVDLDEGLDRVTFLPLGQDQPMSWRESLDKNYTDGVIVLHRGRIVYEKYFGELVHTPIHVAMSVSKTFTGTLGALLVAEGVIDENKRCEDYLPELKGSAFGRATFRQVLDMTTALDFSEDYADPKAHIWAYSLAGNPFPKPQGYEGPTNYYDYLKTVKQKGVHGQAFGYKTVNTDVVAWVVSRVLDRPLAQILSERIFQPMGMHYDGYYLTDGSGIAFAGGGLSLNLRDMAMFGEMMRQGGRFSGRQILPPQVVEDVRRGGSREAFAKAGYTNLKGWSYRNMWWVTHNEHGAFSARGVHGQTIYVDPKAEMVIVRFASHPVASNGANDPYSLPAYHAVAKYLMARGK